MKTAWRRMGTGGKKLYSLKGANGTVTNYVLQLKLQRNLTLILCIDQSEQKGKKSGK